MKKLYTLLLLPCFFLSAVQAQVSFTVTDSIYIFEDIDLSDEFVELSVDNWFNNETSDSLNIRWTFVGGDCPLSWDFTKLDELLSYLPWVTTNVEPPPSSLNNPILLEPRETESLLYLRFYPRQTPGCCTVSFELSLAENPATEIIATATYEIQVNAPPECLAVPTIEAGNNNIEIYPNPTFGQLHVESEFSIKNISVYSAHGHAFGEIYMSGENEIDLSHLPVGIYFLKINMEGGKTGWARVRKI